jgi:hypothetical protein
MRGRKRQDLAGCRFGRLLIKGIIKRFDGKYQWECLCDCGKTTFVSSSHLLNGSTSSCGCLHKEKVKKRFYSFAYKHGFHKTRLYHTWANMKRRCLKKGSENYDNYGGRGITLCKEWLDFIPFRDWALAHGYQDNLTIDRINNDDGYYPENCRWVDHAVQNRNTSRNRYLTFNGETMTVMDWSKRINISYSSIQNRLSLGWDVERVLTTPVRK